MSELVEVLKSNAGSVILKDPSAISKDVKGYIDSVINTCKNGDTGKKTELDEITVDGLDANQVWWQVKLVLDSIDGDLIQGIQELRDVVLPSSNDISDEENINLASEEESEREEGENYPEEEPILPDDASEVEKEVDDIVSEKDEEPIFTDNESTTDGEKENHVGKEKKPYIRNEDNPSADPYGVNDEFFDLEQFNRDTLAAENIDAAAGGDKDAEIDYFQDIPSAEEEEEEAVYYEDFFDKPAKKSMSKKNDANASEDDEELNDKERDSAMNKVKLDLFAEEEDELNAEEMDNSSDKNLSTFEKQQLEISKQIEKLEKEAVAEKKWSLKGEVKAKDRPDDALLTEDLEFDRTAKPVPVITSEVTESLEDMIRRRIQDSNFDDLQRRTLLDVSRKSQRPQFELSDVKSSKSLAEIYENDYAHAEDESALSEELKKAHSEISELYTSLVYKLDVLSSVHFTPKPASSSLEIRVETPAISMEDAQPLYMSNASTLAPQEVYNVGKAEKDGEIRLKNGVAMSKEELSREDKNRLRRSLKRKRSKAISSNSHKKSKKNEVVDTLSRARNITVINQKGEKKDVSGKSKRNASGPDSTNIKL
ncbi:mpp10p [Saccharomyces arboricola H-6]|uniref:U3 small nucleolar ribonucleoprotein protein MPP10 n=1 Tax=Saccharomyces arboricola (strain H-6 / AS 2.3317 / CBS 10644) TaxID=1160507 RepID=J8PLN0_SACAR|nr:mpp10p [Saccharomyces arboricola H-6]